MDRTLQSAAGARRAPPVQVLAARVGEDDLQALAELLVDAVDSGSSVSFLAPLEPAQAKKWWRGAIASAQPRSALLVCREAGRILACVQLCAVWAPNQPHRAEVCKMLVHRRVRRRGIGRALLEALELQAAASGFSLLTLDTCRGDAGEALYRSCGWSEAGVIPGYALTTEAGLCDSVFFYKRIPLAAARSAST